MTTQNSCSVSNASRMAMMFGCFNTLKISISCRKLLKSRSVFPFFAMNLIADVSPVNFFLALYTFPNDPSPTKSSKLYSERRLLLFLSPLAFVVVDIVLIEIILAFDDVSLPLSSSSSDRRRRRRDDGEEATMNAPPPFIKFSLLLFSSSYSSSSSSSSKRILVFEKKN